MSTLLVLGGLAALVVALSLAGLWGVPKVQFHDPRADGRVRHREQAVGLGAAVCVVIAIAAFMKACR